MSNEFKNSGGLEWNDPINENHPSYKEYDISVPWSAQTLLVQRVYECRRCQYATERYRAIGNDVAHAHLCRLCWEELPPDAQKCYMGVEEIE